MRCDSKVSQTHAVGQTHAIVQRVIRLVIETNMLTGNCLLAERLILAAYAKKLEPSLDCFYRCHSLLCIPTQELSLRPCDYSHKAILQLDARYI